jgi:hypothetical protein
MPSGRRSRRAPIGLTGDIAALNKRLWELGFGAIWKK